MTAELLTLSRKVDLALAKTDLVLTKLDELNHTGRPGITQVAFAKLLKKHPRTISRWIADKKLRLEKGLVPNSEVRRFLS